MAQPRSTQEDNSYAYGRYKLTTRSTTQFPETCNRSRTLLPTPMDMGMERAAMPLRRHTPRKRRTGTRTMARRSHSADDRKSREFFYLHVFCSSLLDTITPKSLIHASSDLITYPRASEVYLCLDNETPKCLCNACSLVPSILRRDEGSRETRSRR